MRNLVGPVTVSGESVGMAINLFNRLTDDLAVFALFALFGRIRMLANCVDLADLGLGFRTHTAPAWPEVPALQTKAKYRQPIKAVGRNEQSNKQNSNQRQANNNKPQPKPANNKFNDLV